VCQTPWRANGTAATVTPWVGLLTHGASASMNTRIVPASNARHLRRPLPGRTGGSVAHTAPSNAHALAEPTRHHHGVVIELDGLDDHPIVDADTRPAIWD
jgi:hypothetical protein